MTMASKVPKNRLKVLYWCGLSAANWYRCASSIAKLAFNASYRLLARVKMYGRCSAIKLNDSVCGSVGRIICSHQHSGRSS